MACTIFNQTYKKEFLATIQPQVFPNDLAEFVYYRTYSRWVDELGRREMWHESVGRYLDYIFLKAGDALTDLDRRDLLQAVSRQDVLGSMRLFWAAGPACDASNVTAYNCSALPISDLRSFAEILYVLMCGTGVGFSVEEEFVSELPRIQKIKRVEPIKYVIEDSKEGWANSLLFGLETWFSGGDVDFDFSGLRPQGARLYTMGGRSSGPEPLKRLLEFVRNKVRSRAGKRLRTVDCHDIACMIGEVVVVGGVRRSSEISLSDPEDYEMRMAKFGAFYNVHPYRSMANNSAVYNEQPSAVQFMEEFLSLAKSGSGERGIFNRASAQKASPRRKRNILYLTNPCGEILLRPYQFCNLSSVTCRADYNGEDLRRNVRLATILGTVQSTLTNFPYLREEWKRNCEEERLLGVSLSGQSDCPIVRDASVLQGLLGEAIETNRIYAERLGINPSAAITCVKPEGTSSQLVGASSGIHVRWSPYYIRRIRISATDPLFKLARDSGFPCEPEAGQDSATASTWVLSFPQKSPEGAITRKDVTAIDQLERWRLIKENYTEHNPSCTIYVGESEWIAVMNWVYSHWDIVGGISFLPKDDHIYRLAPYEEITAERYEELLAALPKIDYSRLSEYETDDMTTGAKDYACIGGSCEI